MTETKTSARWARSGLVGAAVLALMAAVPAVAMADSPVIGASDGQCAAKWYSRTNEFLIDDQDLEDDDYCYVQFSFQSDYEPFSRIVHPQDVGKHEFYPVKNPGGAAVIYWNLCKERQNDDDVCAYEGIEEWRQDAT